LLTFNLTEIYVLIALHYAKQQFGLFELHLVTFFDPFSQFLKLKKLSTKPLKTSTLLTCVENRSFEVTELKQQV